MALAITLIVVGAVIFSFALGGLLLAASDREEG